jgi:hypothetical protein
VCAIHLWITRAHARAGASARRRAHARGRKAAILSIRPIGRGAAIAAARVDRTRISRQMHLAQALTGCARLASRARWRACAFGLVALPALVACSFTTNLDGLVTDSSSHTDGGASLNAARDGGARIDGPAAEASAESNDAAVAPDDATTEDAGDDSALPPPPPIDAGCTGSGAVTVGAPKTLSPVFGGTGGSPFDQTCPSGGALVGFHVVTSSISPQSISQIQGLCAPLTRSGCGVAVGSPVPMANNGYTSGASSSVMCPPNQVVVGVRANSGTLVDAITIDCAPIFASGATWTFGARTLVGPAGGDGGGANAPFDCSAPAVANEIRGQYGDWIEQIQLGCGPL